MSKPMKTPGVYIKELDAFGNSVVPVPTAVPAFIGYTEQTKFNGTDLLNKPIKVDSLAKFKSIFEPANPELRPSISFKVEMEKPRKLPDGTTEFYIGTSKPASYVGETGDRYYDMTKNVMYEAKVAYSWTKNTNTASGEGAPDENAGSGKTSYLDLTDGTLYERADATKKWPKKGTNVELKTSDTTGAPGIEIGDPGSYYYDGTDVYGPKEGGWPTTTNAVVVGTLASGATVPADTDGAEGDFFVDEDNNMLYGPKGSADWGTTAGVSLSEETPTFSNNGVDYYVSPTSKIHRLHSAMKFFYANGGGDCYIVSIGDYDSEFKADDFTAAITSLKKEMEPTMLVIPDAVELADANSTEPLADKYAQTYALQAAMINHCGDMMNRVAILDIPGGYDEPITEPTASVKAFRNAVTPLNAKFNSYAAAYYPWLHTSVYGPSDITYKNIDSASYSTVHDILSAEFSGVDTYTNDDGDLIPEIVQVLSFFTETPDGGATNMTMETADSILKNISAMYPFILEKIEEKLNLMPPSAAMAGIYTATDNSDGVWKAPANVGVQSMIAPAVKIDHEMQQDLNVPLSGKSVCAIRAFTGRGNLVWGARTLDGNSNDWRYINVRRTLIFIEQSVKDAAKAYVFAPNDASTWVNVQSMISNFLTGVWNQGGLVGPKPADAFSVTVGLGSTMTNDDIQNGIMRVMVKVAVSHPAEFIEITFQQQMQKA